MWAKEYLCQLPYIKICLMLNYLGQAAWLLKVYQDPAYQQIENLNPFFQALPQGWTVFGVGFSALAAIIASQALLSGSFTLVSEAIKLRLFCADADHVSWFFHRTNVYPIPALKPDAVDRLFRCRSLIPDIHANGGPAYGLAITVNYADDHSLVIFLFASIQKSAIYRSIYYLIFCSYRRHLLHLECRKIFPRWVRCGFDGRFDYRHHAPFGNGGQPHSRTSCRRS